MLLYKLNDLIIFFYAILTFIFYVYIPNYICKYIYNEILIQLQNYLCFNNILLFIRDL